MLRQRCDPELSDYQLLTRAQGIQIGEEVEHHSEETAKTERL